MEKAPTVDGAVLRRARERAGLTQHELAREVGVAGGERISLWERGASRPRSPQILHRLANALNVDPGSLLTPPETGPDLRWLRFVAGLSVSQVADACHTSVAAVKRWEAGAVRPPSTGTVEALAAALACNVSDVRGALNRRH